MAASSYKYPDVKTDVSVDAALMDFYTSYPTSATAENFMTRWAYYARTPLCDRAKSTLYPMLRARTQNLDKLAATELILNWAQQSLPYGYDDEIWGGDRAFFPDETLFYPKCDCEDHAILFVRLIRDILGLKTALIYYPGHLASAVNFPAGSMAKGDYVDIDGERFYICDQPQSCRSIYARLPAGKCYRYHSGITTGYNNTKKIPSQSKTLGSFFHKTHNY